MSPTIINTIIILILFTSTTDSLLILDKLAQIKDKLVAKEFVHIQPTMLSYIKHNHFFANLIHNLNHDDSANKDQSNVYSQVWKVSLMMFVYEQRWQGIR